MQYASWQYSISPNSVVSVISAIAKAALLIPVSSCLGQLKWQQGSHQIATSLYHFHILDQASRGPWGAVEIFWRIRSPLAIAGASLMVLSIALDPFTQQILAFPSRDVPALHETAYVQRAQEYVSEWRNDWHYVEPAMQVAIMTGVAQMNQHLEPFCPSARCEYPDFATLGICASCEDVTEQTEQICRPYSDSSEWSKIPELQAVPANCSYSTPGGFQFIPTNLCWYKIDNGVVVCRAPFTSITSEPPLNTVASLVMAKYDPDEVIFSTTNIRLAEKKPSMTECSLKWCERLYIQNNVSISNRILKPSRVQTLEVEGERLYTNGTQRLIPIGGRESFSGQLPYRVDVYSHGALVNHLGSVLNTTIDANSPDFSTPLASTLLSIDNTTESMNQVATSMTDHIRSTAKAVQVPGQAFRTETFIHVRWVWILIPTVLIASSIILLISTAIGNRAHPVLWKSSIFPLIMGRLNTFPEHEIAHLRHIRELQCIAKDINVVVEQDQESVIIQER
ncbi:hypothetical protein BDV59DRAFT_176929 [Aspergillus ambiguus]|uniref:DUF3176 domain-containing protein n=1 Tax=Aspergillus ambiguus TaxID=176160 RepID=UPI003CCCE5F6